MRARVLMSFSGVLTASVGDVIDVVDDYIYNDLLQAGYIEPDTEETEEVSTPKKRKKRA